MLVFNSVVHPFIVGVTWLTTSQSKSVGNLGEEEQ
jgi:hypothetical protein